jgi:ATP-dependent HslUV protease ATP-binding subunit HslU
MENNNKIMNYYRGQELTPKEIVEELDKYIVGQKDAKKSVAIALRNRYRRKLLPKELAEDIAPKNILMIGPTGVGKTEIARRLAKLTSSPFLKIEASKFTEVGYVGRDVETMIRDLTEIAIHMVKSQKTKEVKSKAEKSVEERLLDIIYPPPKQTREGYPDDYDERLKRWKKNRESWREKLRKGDLDNRKVEIDVKERGVKPLEIFSNSGLEEIGISIQGIFPDMFPSKTKKKSMNISDAKKYLLEEEERNMIDMDEVVNISLQLVEQTGIIFLDEIDKIAGREGGRGPDVSREGVQRDLLPLIEGTSVYTKYGIVKTDHILFIGAGAFHVSKPSDLIPELQGRFPIRVELHALGEKEFVRILKEPKNALTKQYTALMSTEDVHIEFTEDAIHEIARLAEKVNQETENIGARRLHTIIEKVMEEVSFNAPDLKGRQIKIDKKYIDEKLQDIVQDHDLSKYIL